jgi:hypothetical protein
MLRTEPVELIVSKKADGYQLEVLGVPFGGPQGGKDLDGEFFSSRTNIMLAIGEARPVFYAHGDKQADPELIGKAVYDRVDEKGHWFRVELNKGAQVAKGIYEAAIAGLARASSGAIAHLVRAVRQTGELLVWPVGELSLLDAATSHLAANQFAVVNAKALKSGFEQAGIPMPEMFAGAEARADEAGAEASAITGGLNYRVRIETIKGVTPWTTKS